MWGCNVKKSLALLVATVAFGFGSIANAADIPLKARPMAAPVYSWTGFYAGGNVGYGWGTSSIGSAVTPAAGPVFDTGSDRTNVNGVIGGLQAGYNWQTGALVLGLETDIQISGQNGSGTAACPFAACGAGGTLSHSEKLSWFGTTRGRVGWAFDRWMVYGTGGAAYGEVKVDGALNVPAAPGVMPFNGSSTRVGWTAGAGVEAALIANWTWKLEYLHMDFGSATFATALPSPPFIVGTFSDSVRLRDDVVRLGANHRF